jgi:acyl carrier protein
MTIDRADILRDVRRVLEEHLKIGDVDEATHLFRDLELDSIQQLTFVVELENHFKICFDEGDESGIQTIGDVVDAVAKRTGEA